MHRQALALAVLFAAVALAGCEAPPAGFSGDGGTSLPPAARTSPDAIDAFRAAGLAVGETRPMTKDDYGAAPLRAEEGTRFILPSLCEADEVPCDSGGRAMSFKTAEDQAAVKEYYVELGRASAMLFSWVFEKDNLLVQINGDLPEAEAQRYQAALDGMR